MKAKEATISRHTISPKTQKRAVQKRSRTASGETLQLAKLLSPDVQKYLDVFELEGLQARDIKPLIRETQNELSSAWKFYMGLGADRQVLVISDGFTTLPLSLARICSHVVVYGLQESETAILHKLAEAKSIQNYSCVDHLDNLATQFDIIVLAITEEDPIERRRLIQAIRKFIHSGTELWILSTNEISLHNLRNITKSVLRRLFFLKDSSAEKPPIRLPLAHPPVFKLRRIGEDLRTIGCQPFVLVGLRPSILRLRFARPFVDKRMPSLDGAEASPLERFQIGEVAVGATPAKYSLSFMERLLQHIEFTRDHSFSVQNYWISPSGKVLLFVSRRSGGEEERALVKLPLNEFSRYRLQLNQEALKKLLELAKRRKGEAVFFPEPLQEGEFEGQPYYVERILTGKSGDQISFSKTEKSHVVYEVLSLWSGIQKSLERRYYIDETAFDELIAAPLEQVFRFFDRNGEQKEILRRLQDYLRRRFLDTEMHLSLIHGDFSLKNIIFHEKLLTFKGIVDWDLSQPLGFPILDLYHFFVREARISYQKSPVMILWQILDRRKHNDSFAPLLDMYRQTFLIDEAQLHGFAILYWMQRISAHMGTIKFLDRGFMKRNFHTPLNIFETHLLAD